MSKIANELHNIGLPEKSALVYAYLLKAGIAFPSRISIATKLNRSTVYNILSDLKAKGLVTEIERGKKLCYQIEDPVRLPGIIKQQISKAEERYEQAKALLPELQGLFSLIPNKPVVRFFEGVDGIISVYNEHVTVAEPYEMLSYSNVEELFKRLPKTFVSSYVKKKTNIGITTRAIFPDSDFSKKYNAKIYGDTPNALHIHSKLIPTKSFPFQADVTMFGKNKVSIINFKDDVMIGVIIEDETIAGILRMSFELAWRGVGQKQ